MQSVNELCEKGNSLSEVGMYQEAYSKINSIIKNTGWVGSNDFNNNQSQMSSQTGAQNQASNASQSQQTANSKYF